MTPSDFNQGAAPRQDQTQLTGGGNGGQPPDRGQAEFGVGDIIGGDYQVLRWIGAGGMGNVYCVRHTIMQTEYALKTLSADKVTEVAWRRFQNEAQAIARMQHPNIVAIYNLDLHNGQLPFYVMDLLKGPSMLDLLRDYGPMELKQALPLFIELCSGFGYAHKKGIVHRDIKPPNIVLPEISEPGCRVKIVDFGIAKLSGIKDPQNQHLTNAGEVCGSPFYMSPEQTEGKRIDARSDIYSLGCTMFEMLTGTPPYRGRSAVDTMLMHQTSKIPTLKATSGGKYFPEMLEEIMAALLAKQPMDRYQTMELLSQDLNTILSGQRTYINPYTSTATAELRRPEIVTADGKKAALTGEALPSRIYQPDEDEHESSPWRKLITIGGITIGAAAALGLLAWGAIFLQTHLTPPKSVVKPAMIDDTLEKKATAIVDALPDADRVCGRSERNAQTPTKSLKDQTPFAQTEMVAGVRMRTFHLPDDITIGDIKGSVHKNCVSASGTVGGIAMTDKVSFYPEEVLLKYPGYLKRFRPGDVERLIFEGSVPTDDLVKLTATIPGVKHVQFTDCPQVTPAGFEATLGMKSLESIGLENQGPAERVTPILARLKNITMAEFVHQKPHDMEQILLACKQCPQLHTLYLDHSAISRKSFEILSTMPQLETLTMDNSTFRGEDFDLLASSKNLRELSLLGCKFSSEIVGNLAKIGSLRLLQVNDHASEHHFWTELSHSLPKLKYQLKNDHSDALPSNFGLPQEP